MEETQEKKKILVIDDNEGLNTVLVDKFKISGFVARGASDGEDGLKKALEFHPDMILLDLVMPKMDGIEMLKKLREDEWGKNAKVIVLTLLDKVDYVAETMKNNIYGYLVKTDLGLDDIVKKIQDILK